MCRSCGVVVVVVVVRYEQIAEGQLPHIAKPRTTGGGDKAANKDQVGRSNRGQPGSSSSIQR